MQRRFVRAIIRGVAAFVAAAAFAVPVPAAAEASVVRISYGYGTLYLPLMVMDRERLIEKHAAALGVPSVNIEWKTFDGGNVINDAMLSGALDIAGIGVPRWVSRAMSNPDRAFFDDSTSVGGGARWRCSVRPEHP